MLSKIALLSYNSNFPSSNILLPICTIFPPISAQCVFQSRHPIANGKYEILSLSFCNVRKDLRSTVPNHIFQNHLVTRV